MYATNGLAISPTFRTSGGFVHAAHRGTWAASAREDVAELQRALNAAGANPPLREDGLLGPLTASALRAFQLEAGLLGDGLDSPDIRGALGGRQSPSRRPELARLAPRPGERAPEGATPVRSLGIPSLEAARAGGAPRSGTQPRTATFDRIQNRGQRNQMVTGRLTINGNTYEFRSGGYRNGNLPAGRYTVTPHMWDRDTRGMTVGGVGYSFALNNAYDRRVGAVRSNLRIHPDGGAVGTEGCMGIVGNAETQRRFREDMRAEITRSGGSFTLNVG
ncbi:MAG: peptidoglycan-binding protein [Deltaproteobacteria bacterium]|nr:peptidoglycan-binding protein [Deltaproteobacteria bacterium]